MEFITFEQEMKYEEPIMKLHLIRLLSVFPGRLKLY